MSGVGGEKKKRKTMFRAGVGEEGEFELATLNIGMIFATGVAEGRRYWGAVGRAIPSSPPPIKQTDLVKAGGEESQTQTTRAGQR